MAIKLIWAPKRMSNRQAGNDCLIIPFAGLLIAEQQQGRIAPAKIAVSLNARDIDSPRGNDWNASGVSRMLKRLVDLGYPLRRMSRADAAALPRQNRKTPAEHRAAYIAERVARARREDRRRSEREDAASLSDEDAISVCSSVADPPMFENIASEQTDTNTAPTNEDESITLTHSVQDHVTDNPKTQITWPLWWDGDAGVSGGDLRKVVTDCLERRKRMLLVLKNCAEQGSHRERTKLIRRYLRSASARVAAAAAAHAKKIGSLNHATENALVRLMTNAKRSNAWECPDERVFSKPRERMNGVPRYTYSRGVRGYAIELLAKDVAEIMVHVHPNQFIVKGRGRPKLEEWLAAVLPGAAVVITTDIPSCFESIKRSSVVSVLPLPWKVTRAILFDPKDRAIFLKGSSQGYNPMDDTLISEVSSPGEGIPQGSALATLAAEAVMKRIIDAVEAVGDGVV